MTVKEAYKESLIKALRCIGSNHIEKSYCSECPVYIVERDDEPATIQYLLGDFTIDGVHYWEGCDVDKAILYAADMLEGMI